MHFEKATNASLLEYKEMKRHDVDGTVIILYTIPCSSIFGFLFIHRTTIHSSAATYIYYDSSFCVRQINHDGSPTCHLPHSCCHH